MRHTFYVCQSAAETLGLGKILNFYNTIVLENSDGVEDLINEGENIFVAEDLSSPKLGDFVKNLSYGENPFILSNVQSATIKLSQLYPWEISGKLGESTSGSLHHNLIKFNIYKSGSDLIFGNIFRSLLKTYEGHQIEILDWSEDYIAKVEDFVKNVDINQLKDGYNTVEANLEETGKLVQSNVYFDPLPQGIDIYTQCQIMNNESPLVLHEIYKDVTDADDLDFHEDFKKENPKSQTRPYDVTLVNIKAQYESVIKNDMPSGVWKFGGDSTGKFEQQCIYKYSIDEEGDKSLCLLHRGCTLYDINSSEGFIISTRNKNKSLSTGDTIASIKIPFNVVNKENDLHAWVYETIHAILHIQMG